MKDCDKGYKGDCCCNCVAQRKIHICPCERCSNVKGYICIGQEGDINACWHSFDKHGCCELHERMVI